MGPGGLSGKVRRGRLPSPPIPGRAGGGTGKVGRESGMRGAAFLSSGITLPDAMPRQARPDAPCTLHHLLQHGGLPRRAIFTDDADRARPSQRPAGRPRTRPATGEDYTINATSRIPAGPRPPRPAPGGGSAGCGSLGSPPPLGRCRGPAPLCHHHPGRPRPRKHRESPSLGPRVPIQSP